MALKFTASANGRNSTDLLPDGPYDATLVKVEEARNADGSYLRWTFEVARHGEARTVTGVTGATLDSGEKARYWVEALVGRPLKDDEEVDLEKLYGRSCRLEITTVNKEGRDFNKIVRATKRGGVTLKAPPTQPPTEGGEPDDGEGVF